MQKYSVFMTNKCQIAFESIVKYFLEHCTSFLSQIFGVSIIYLLLSISGNNTHSSYTCRDPKRTTHFNSSSTNTQNERHVPFVPSLTHSTLAKTGANSLFFIACDAVRAQRTGLACVVCLLFFSSLCLINHTLHF